HKVVFKMLGEEVIREIAIKDLEILDQRMQKQKAKLVYNEELLDYLAFNGTDVNNGARPLMRLINRKVLAPISRKLLTLPKRKNIEYIFKEVVKEIGRASCRERVKIMDR